MQQTLDSMWHVYDADFAAGCQNDPVWFLNTHNVFESLVHVANKMFGLSGCSSQYRTKDLSVISFHCDFKVTLSASGATFLFWVFVSKLSSATCHIQTHNPINSDD